MGDHAHIQNTIVCRGSTLHDRCSLRDCQVCPRRGRFSLSALCVISGLTIQPCCMTRVPKAYVMTSTLALPACRTMRR